MDVGAQHCRRTSAAAGAAATSGARANLFELIELESWLEQGQCNNDVLVAPHLDGIGAHNEGEFQQSRS